MKTVYIGGLDFSLIGRLYFNVNRELKQCALGLGVGGSIPIFWCLEGSKGPQAPLLVLGATFQIENPIQIGSDRKINLN